LVGKDPVELEKYLEKKIRRRYEYKHFNFVQSIAAFISTVTKYYSSYVAVPFFRKITKN
jgi:mannitol-specific phosphotransferase system IIBC component